ncbi:hypothetical protein HOY80DRAFT_1097701 [Tuber brumale]|nr:hypothetical protein HOY80DRAFT_1097701 [Tuber brumale]
MSPIRIPALFVLKPAKLLKSTQTKLTPFNTFGGQIYYWLTGNPKPKESARKRTETGRREKRKSTGHPQLLTRVAIQYRIIEMCHPIVHPFPGCYPAPYSKEGLLEGYCKYEQEVSGSESERESSPIPRSCLHIPETPNTPPEAPPAPEAQMETSDTQAEEGIPLTALEELALLLTSTDKPSKDGHGGTGEEELAVELQNHTRILQDAADENWEREKERYVCVLMEVLLEGLRDEGEGEQIGLAGTRKREFCCEEQGVREAGGSKRRIIVGDEKCLTGRRVGCV